MKLFIAILVSLLLYAPSVSQLLRFADCSAQILANTNPVLCNCDNVKSIFEIPISGKQTQKILSENSVWKYTITEMSTQISAASQFIQNIFSGTEISLPTKGIFAIFHPPIM